MCFHLGMTDGFILDKGVTNKERFLTEEETEEILLDINREIEKRKVVELF